MSARSTRWSAQSRPRCGRATANTATTTAPWIQTSFQATNNGPSDASWNTAMLATTLTASAAIQIIRCLTCLLTVSESRTRDGTDDTESKNTLSTKISKKRTDS